MIEREDNESRRRLLRSFPDVEIRTDGTEVIDALVQGATSELLSRKGGAALLTANDVVRTIRESIGLEYDKSEIVASLERLAQVGHVHFRDGSHRAFVFSDERLAALTAQREYKNALEVEAKASWVAQVTERNGLSEQEGEQLWMALDALITNLVHSRAEEAASFLYMNDAMGQVRFYSLLDAKLPALQEGLPPHLVDIAHREFLRFFDPTDKSCVNYLSDRLHAAFYYHLLNIDPSASALVRDRVSDKVFYLDTNVLYRLLGMHGPTLAYSPATAVELSRELDCRIVVARETLNEFVRSLRSEVRKLKDIPLSRDTYRRIAAEHPSDDLEFMQAFYREWNSGRVNSIEEFERKYTNVVAFLDNWGIEIDENAVCREADRRGADYEEQFSMLNNWHRMEKPVESVDHDVFLWR